MVSDRMTAEDLVQNIFLKLHENISSIKFQESIKYWLFRTARNEIYGWYRKQKSYRKVFDPADLEEIEVNSGVDLGAEIEIKEFSFYLTNELSNLPEEQKEIFILKEYGGLSYNEIAEIMSITEDLVKSRLFKIRKKLVERLAKKIK
jgi:RNA polymerase sigma-70 factor, ECF subfamily